MGIYGDFMKVTNELVTQVKKELLDRLVSLLILESKNQIVSWKYAIDTRDTTDNNNIKLARFVSDSVFPQLNEIVADVYNKMTLGEK
jgi:hypothetical protein